MYKAILLDVFGTLVVDDEGPAAAHVAALAGVGVAEVRQRWDALLWELADGAHGDDFRLLADLTCDSLDQTADHFGVRVDARELCAVSPGPLYADALPFLQALEVPVCLVSDADRDVLARHPLPVDHVVTSEDARAYKPRPEPFLMALELLGCSAAEVIHIGDSPAADITGAAALGIDTVFLSRFGRRLPDHLSATHTVPTLTAIPPIRAS